ncbi:hypothetical protein GDO81_014700 [Engystomops pustulosus]|uniref:Uncharacterized protein n=1 Tax=Engystomops pustulosus TaxID=76066 RepID=A0AAV7BCJ5_ENGPU|nr:hypothetical protein GDO81_014700 [Engystomops pustulosus]
MSKILAHEHVNDWVDTTVKTSQNNNSNINYIEVEGFFIMHGYYWPHVIWSPADEETQYNGGDDPVGSLRSLGSITISKFAGNGDITGDDDEERDHKQHK